MAHFLYLAAEATTMSSSSCVAAFFVVLWLRRVVRRFRAVCAVGCVCAAHCSARVLGHS